MIILPKYMLTLDTSGGSTSACVYDVMNGVSLADRYEPITMSQGEYILPIIDEVLTESNLKRNDIDAVGVCTGPGFFTGMRIGLSTAQGLSFGLGVKFYGVSSLQALAHQGATMGHIIVMQETKRSDIYVQKFNNLIPDGDILSLESMYINIKSNTKLIGSASIRYMLETNTKFDVIETTEFPTAKSVAIAIVNNLESNIYCPIVPIYLRAPDVSLPKEKK